MQRPVPAPTGAVIEPAFADLLAGGVGSGALPFHPAHVSIQVVPAATTALMAAAVAAATNSAGAGAVLVLVLVLVLVMVMVMVRVLVLAVFDATRVERVSPSPMSEKDWQRTARDCEQIKQMKRRRSVVKEKRRAKRHAKQGQQEQQGTPGKKWSRGSQARRGAGGGRINAA
jgi:hypothetical protein